MTIPLVVPLDVPTDGIEHGEHAFGSLEPLIGLGTCVLIMAILLAAFFFLRHRGLVPPLRVLTWAGRAESPEQSARQVLADRFARGDISSDDFLERASVLNWTPGVDSHPPRGVGRN